MASLENKTKIANISNNPQLIGFGIGLVNIFGCMQYCSMYIVYVKREVGRASQLISNTDRFSMFRYKVR